MKPSELRDMDIDELARKETELHKELFKNNLQKELGVLTKTDIFRQLKKDIARIKTIITEKKAQAAKDPVKG
ncbi:MAG: 50S ribosomal protein L29 [Deltaproteobacteria bacterium]|nr:50S ribosomal protein L29 [Deltaproteobacteria bacterium]